MDHNDGEGPSIGDVARVRRRAVADAPRAWVREHPAAEGLPLILTPAVDGLDPEAWARENRPWIDERLRRHGALLLSGFDLPDVEAFERFVAAASDRPMDYEDRTSPRSHVRGRVYTSTDHPPDQPILLHNENSYSFSWPMKIFFYCVTPAAEGGATPIADCRRVAAALEPALVERFRRRRVMYVRNFGDGFGLPWSEVFRTDDPAEVEAFCRRNAIEWEWKQGGRLRTRQVRPAVVDHPVTGETVWFNQALLFHPAGLAPEVRAQLLAEFGEEGLPSHARYGDGTPIESAALAAIAAAYERATVARPWRRGELLMLDNMLVAHGREPYAGPRKVVVGMSEPMALTALPGEAG
jgi:alpha-ketoglutarate-dependent taurine dioxygenase